MKEAEKIIRESAVYFRVGEAPDIFRAAIPDETLNQIRGKKVILAIVPLAELSKGE